VLYRERRSSLLDTPFSSYNFDQLVDPILKDAFIKKLPPSDAQRAGLALHAMVTLLDSA